MGHFFLRKKHFPQKLIHQKLEVNDLSNIFLKPNLPQPRCAQVTQKSPVPNLACCSGRRASIVSLCIFFLVKHRASGSSLTLDNQWIVWYARQQGTKMQASPWWDWECEVMLLMKKIAKQISSGQFRVFQLGCFSPSQIQRGEGFGLLLLGSPTKNIAIVVTVTCQGDNPEV